MKRNENRGRRLSVLPVLTAAAVLLCFLAAVGQLDSGLDEEARQQLEESLRRAAVAYYAAEGVYPPTLEDLIQRSGVQIPRERCRVFYEIFADNLMPDITVLGMEP